MNNSDPLFDTHCHFDFAPFAADWPQALAVCLAQDVTKILVPSIEAGNWRRVQMLAEHFPQTVYYGLGVHPHYLNTIHGQTMARLKMALSAAGVGCVAIGECGLDASLTTPMAEQEAIFAQHLALAEQYQLPVVIHSRKTHSLIAKWLRRFPEIPGGVIHGFSGSYQQALELVDLGMNLGVGGTITYSRANKTRQAIRQLPLDSLVLETDAPDMPLCGRQGTPNHPQFLPEVLESLVGLRAESRSEIVTALWQNSHQLFRIPMPPRQG